jgi:Xaa-Pro aminopeptidase
MKKRLIFLSILIFGLNLKGDEMAATVQENHDFSLNIARRKDLINAIKETHPSKDGVVFLFAGFEGDAKSFRQDSSFYYLTGLVEPGIVMTIDLKGQTAVYTPNCGNVRSQWMMSEVDLSPANSKKLGINDIKVLGSVCAGYTFHPFFPKEEYSLLLEELKNLMAQKKTIFTLSPNNAREYVEQRLILQRLEGFLPGLSEHIVDISPLVAHLRRIKDRKELDIMFLSTEIAMMAQEAAAQAIEDGAMECEVQASLEYVFTAAGATPSFPSIVAGGKNSTVLHYTINNGTLKNGDLVVVDIGAEYGHYCSDLTRTYPVSGKFTPRQKEIYNIVLDTQEYIASIAKPGYWLNNPDMPEKSLNHLAKAFLAKKGYDKYFFHGIGHYLGLDVHDVGDYKRPLQDGDVITIEPGIYIAAEKIGVRIEDDYWVVKDGVVCLSESLPKRAEEIEAMMNEDDDSELGSDDIDEDEGSDIFNNFDDEDEDDEDDISRA